MLYRKSTEIDKEGNVIGGELKEKCDSFIACLDELKEQYLSDKFNAGTVSGKDQAEKFKKFGDWLKRETQSYNRDKKETDARIERLNSIQDKLSKYCKSSENGKLNQDIILKLMNLIDRGYEEKKKKLEEKNKKIERINRLKKRLYEMEEDLDNVHSLLGGVSHKTHKPDYVPTIDISREPKLPGSMTDDLFHEICEVLEENRGVSAPTNDYKAQRHCTKYVCPLLKMALEYCKKLISENQKFYDRQGTVERFIDGAKKGGVTLNMVLMCEWDDGGVPRMKSDKWADIYWTEIMIGNGKAFKECMSKFKDGENGSSSTKKWIKEVEKVLFKGVLETWSGGLPDDVSAYVKSYISKQLDNLAKALIMKPPLSVSARPTIKQKPVQEKLKELSKYVVDVNNK